MKQWTAISLLFASLTLVWFIVNQQHQFNYKIPSATAEELKLFRDTSASATSPQQAFSIQFNNPNYRFPRTAVSEIRLYRNNLFRAFSSKRLKKSFNDSIIAFFNNPDHFDWGESTWQRDEAEYILKFLDEDRNMIGQIYLCLKDCGYLESLPFSPNMKFGRITSKATNIIIKIIKNKAMWQR